MAHRLETAPSAYLRQHAHNPVDWWPWGPEPFAEAASRDVPVFISIGYAACHWCHVMAEESFANDDVAAVLNRQFVSIKVDREEHPDVDERYMSAVQAMTGQGGWPMSVFTLPNGQVFHSGTYFPPRPMGQIPSFTQVLEAVHQAWTQRRDQVHQQAASLAESLHTQRQQLARLATAVETDTDPHRVINRDQVTTVLGQTLEKLSELEDSTHGGFGAAPKFPPSPLLPALLLESAWQPNSPATGLAIRTMEAMARSGLFDQVEGGFARYATDRAWALPHFEKMLYDNAQLLGSYAQLSVHPAASNQQRADAQRTARMSIQWLLQRMRTGAGDQDEPHLLASSLDADTVEPDGTHVEGGTYLFSDRELSCLAEEAGLEPEEASDFLALNHGIPAEAPAQPGQPPLPVTETTARTVHFDAPLTPEQRELFNAVLPQLRRRRAQRIQPARDDKVVAAWNAQAVRSLAQAAALWGDDALLASAVGLAEQLWAVHVEPMDSAVQPAPEPAEQARVYRTSYQGRRSQSVGTLADHAQLAAACYALVSAGAEHHWLTRGHAVLRFTCEQFVTVEGNGEVTVLESLPQGDSPATAGDTAYASPLDGPEPSSVAVLAHALGQAVAFGLTDLPLHPAQLLQHLPLVAPQAPQVAGGSLLAGLTAAQQFPAFRFIAGSSADLAQVRRAGALYTVAVETVEAAAITGGNLQLSVCLNGTDSMVCLPPVDSIKAALATIRSS